MVSQQQLIGVQLINIITVRNRIFIKGKKYIKQKIKREETNSQLG